MTPLFRAGTIPLVLLLCLSCAPAGRRASAGSAPAAVSSPPELVVLVHGLGRSSLSMMPLAWTLEHAGYQVMNWGYRSTCCGIPELGTRLQRDLQSHPAWGATRIHFVGHSLGNILVRWVLARDDRPPSTGRVVMLAPPNQGSRAADRFSPALGWLLKPLPALRTGLMRDAASLVVPEDVPVGVIAGEYDGKVSVAETRLEGMDSHLVIPATHSFLMLRPDVHRLVATFLREGSFVPSAASCITNALDQPDI